MSFHDTRFPVDIALGASGGPQWATDIVTLASGKEERNSRWANARRKFNAGYGVKSLANMEQVLAFFQERRGRFHSFRWRDPFDYSSAASDADISPLDCQIGIGDGSETVMQLTKIYGGNFDPHARPITKPVAGTLRVSVAGSELTQGADFSVDTTSGLVTLSAAPIASAVITAGFEFDVEVRFDSDELDMVLASFEAGDVPHVPVIEVI